MIIILLNIAGFSQTNHKNRRPLDNPNKITQNSAHAPPDLWKVCKNLTKNSIWIWKDILKVKQDSNFEHLPIYCYVSGTKTEWLVERMIYPLFTHFKQMIFSCFFTQITWWMTKIKSKPCPPVKFLYTTDFVYT